MTDPQDSLPSGKPEGAPWLAPHLAVKDITAAVGFYTRAFGFTARNVLATGDGKAYHAELVWHDAVIMLNPESADVRPPSARGGPSQHLYVYVDAVDALYDRALDEGAMPLRSPRTEYWGDRVCLLADPDGHTWMFATHVAGHDAWRAARAELAERKKAEEET